MANGWCLVHASCFLTIQRMVFILLSFYSSTRLTKSSRAWNLVENVTFACEMAWYAFWNIIVENKKNEISKGYDNRISKIQLVNNRIGVATVKLPENHEIPFYISSIYLHGRKKKQFLFICSVASIYIGFISPFQSSHSYRTKRTKPFLCLKQLIK